MGERQYSRHFHNSKVPMCRRWLVGRAGSSRKPPHFHRMVFHLASWRSSVFTTRQAQARYLKKTSGAFLHVVLDVDTVPLWFIGKYVFPTASLSLYMDSGVSAFANGAVGPGQVVTPSIPLAYHNPSSPPPFDNDTSPFTCNHTPCNK